LFTLNVLLATLLFAWLAKQAGLSMELGAFVAGMLIAETEFRFQVEEDIKPFRDILLGLFFITVGMLVDVSWIAQNLLLVTGLLLAMLALKALVLLGVMAASGTDSGVSLRVALALSPAGEFGFVLLTLALGQGTLSPEVMQPVLAAMVLSMIAAPFIIEHSEQLVRRWRGSDWMIRAMQLTQIASQTMVADRHVIICGYGRSGREARGGEAAAQAAARAMDSPGGRVLTTAGGGARRAGVGARGEPHAPRAQQ
jgi:CPA2 family monovalent cation:H+ antiporter-2